LDYGEKISQSGGNCKGILETGDIGDDKKEELFLTLFLVIAGTIENAF